MKKIRDYDNEFKDSDNKYGGRKYAYSFDYDVLHHYMIESFKPFFLRKIIRARKFSRSFYISPNKIF